MQTPTPGRIAVLRHLIVHPVRVTGNVAAGLLPTMVTVEDADGDHTYVRLLPSPASLG